MKEFSKPPINELVLDVQYQPIATLDTLMLHEIRQLFIDGYPGYEEKEPLGEELEADAGSQVFFMLNAMGLPLRRQWYINATDNQLFQFQHNRFVHNWRKLDAPSPKEVYPRFESVQPEFSKYLNLINTYIETKTSKPLIMMQWEITKFNFIPLESSDISEVSDIFTFMGKLKGPGNLFQESVGLQGSSIIKKEDKPFGRLYVKMEVVRREKGRYAAILKLSARGRPDEASMKCCLEKINEANGIINNAFNELTTVGAKEKWY